LKNLLNILFSYKYYLFINKSNVDLNNQVSAIDLYAVRIFYNTGSKEYEVSRYCFEPLPINQNLFDQYQIKGVGAVTAP